MPYICLTRSDIPDGTLQILDLLPNASLRVPGYDPPAQTRYVNRVQNDGLSFVAGVSRGDKYGLAAYILDRVEPGGLQFGTVDVDLNAPGNVLAGDLITLGYGTTGFSFTATDTFPPDPASQEFLSWVGSGGDEAVMANSLIDAVNDPATQALLLAAFGTTITATAGGSLGAGQVTLTADTAGVWGSIYIEESTAGARIDLSDDHLARTFEVFTAAQALNIANRIIARLDAAQALTITNINTAINVEPGVSGCSLASPASLASVADLLSILAGRGYWLPADSALWTLYNWNWHSHIQTPSVAPAAAGSFNFTGLKNDTQMVAGELRPLTIGGDPDPRPVKGITDTYYTDSLVVSILEGHLSKMAAGITLWPDSDRVPQFPWTYQHGLTYQQTTARVVTVYDDDGTILI